MLRSFPAPGESLHCVCTHRLDIACLIGCLLERCGHCDRLLIATLSYHERNLKLMLDWLEAGAVKTLTLLTSIFFRSHKGALWEHTLAEFRARGQRAAAVHSHAKVVCLEFASGVKLVVEGSANLAGNGSGREQFMLVNDNGLHDWHRQWIEEQVSRGEEKEAKP